MKLPECETLLLEQSESVLTVTLNRPKVKNAMSVQMVDELMAVFDEVKDNLDLRAVVLRGAGNTFCAGGDLKDTASLRMGDPSEIPQRLQDFNRKFGRLITTANSIPQALVAVLEGNVLGGGFGLACVSDVAITLTDTTFGLPETGLGLPPAQIAPFVVARVGLTQARRLGVTGGRFKGDEAQKLGLVHFVCENLDDLETVLYEELRKIIRCGPVANATTKRLMLSVGELELETLLDGAAEDFAKAATGPEGMEGTMSFIQKRLPSWANELENN